MAYLSYLSDKKLEAIVRSVVDAGVKALTSKDLGRNVVDPFAVLFEMAAFELSQEQWEKNERIRQAQKTLINQLGNLHQAILGSIVGWNDLGIGSKAGCDIVHHQNKVIAEIKNKHNTVKKSDEIGIYKTFEDLVMRKTSSYKDYTAYFVKIIPKKPLRYDLPFTPSDKATGCSAPTNDRIRVIDGASFYELVTGKKNALKQLFDALPKVLQTCYPNSEQSFTTTQAAHYFQQAYGD